MPNLSKVQPETEEPETTEPESTETAAVHTMKVLDHNGDSTVLTWTTDDDAAVKAACEAFNKMTAPASQGGYGQAAYRTDNGGENAEVIREFDPTAREIMFVRPMQGG